MNLVIGGAGQGKLAWALAMTGLDGSAVSRTPADPRPILAGLETWLRGTEDPWPALEELLVRQPGVTILCDEVGCGVVPLDRSDRDWRERVGRTCCALAERADLVVRLYCGIPTILKGAAPWN